MAQVGKQFHRVSIKRCGRAYWARRVLEAKYARPLEISFVPVKGLNKRFTFMLGMGVTRVLYTNSCTRTRSMTFECGTKLVL